MAILASRVCSPKYGSGHWIASLIPDPDLASSKTGHCMRKFDIYTWEGYITATRRYTYALVNIFSDYLVDIVYVVVRVL